MFGRALESGIPRLAQLNREETSMHVPGTDAPETAAPAGEPIRPTALRRVTDAERERLIVEHMDLVANLARRYANRGEDLDDLTQVGMIGLTKAAARFDPARGEVFARFAIPTVLGEIRRHFRDCTWAVHVPRGLKEANLAVNAAVRRLTGDTGRSPSVADLARDLGWSDAEVLDALEANDAYRATSFSRPVGDESDEQTLEPPSHEPGFAAAETRAAVDGHVRRLPARQQVVLHLYFRKGLTQTEIAQILGISQMHVSRIMRAGLDTLRVSVGELPPEMSASTNRVGRRRRTK
jgi:RNA polymerase sigma-B factor